MILLLLLLLLEYMFYYIFFNHIREDRAEKRLRMRGTCRTFVLIFCSTCCVRSTFCLSGLFQEMDLRTQWIHSHREVYVEE